MPSTIIESVLTGKLDPALLIQWLNEVPLKDVPEDCVLLYCSRSEFVAHFLSYLRKQTDSILQTNSNAHQILQHQSTPEKLLSSRKHHRSISDPTYEADRSNDSLSVKIDRRSHESPCRDRKKMGRRVKTKLFSEEKSKDSISNSISVSSDESRISSGIDRISIISSTPMKNGVKLSEYPNLPQSPVTPTSKSYERCDTPQLKHRHNRSQEKSCLGDYLATAQRSTTKKKKAGKSISDDSDIKTDLDLSNSDMFPEIGARKASSLKSDKRRIKPTNIDKNKKSLSLNSFNSDCFQQPSPLALEDNVAFKQQKVQPKELSNSFEVERSILKQERHKLMEKFNILNSNSATKTVVTPQIKITQKESIEKEQNFTNAELTKVTYKEKLDVLIEIYDILLKNNLILSMNTEIYFLISILLSKQYEEEYLKIESSINESNFTKYLLKTIHNCTYFSVKSLWHQRSVIEVILDKNSLKLLGENKKIRTFYPDLAKFLLNAYGLKCESENSQTQKEVSEPRRSNGVICFNLETDNVENFPSIMSFQNFKKQRDMFYEILRWYSESGCLSPSALRGRVKALLWAGSGAAACSHLARLITSHMLTTIVGDAEASSEESKMSKLARRLTRPAGGGDTPRTPQFHPEEMFYKELIICAESDPFRTAMRDALASELCTLNYQPLPSSDTSKEYINLIKKLSLLGKFLGYVTSLAYQASDTVAKGAAREPIVAVCHTHTAYSAPKERMLEANVALRSCSQPIIDLKGMLTESHQNSRLCITIPWLVQYLSMLDYTTLRIKYYQNLLKQLFNIYTKDLRVVDGKLKNNTIFLKSILGYLFTLPHFPQELFYERRPDPPPEPDLSPVDELDLVTSDSMRSLCPHAQAVTSLVSSSSASASRAAGTFRHITPLSVTVEGNRTSERHLQARLEEEFLKSQPASTRRVLELVTERVCSAAAKDAAQLVGTARDIARARAATLIRESAGESEASLLQAMETIYSEELSSLRTKALEAARGDMARRSAAALAALAGSAPPQLHAVAAARAQQRLSNWMRDHWSTTAILCKDMESELRFLRSYSEPSESAVKVTPRPLDPTALLAPAEQFDSVNISPAQAIIELKELTCLVLEGSPTPTLSHTLRLAASAASPANVFCRPPAQRAILQLSIDLCLACISQRPQEVKEPLLSCLDGIWSVCCGERARVAPPCESEGGAESPPRPYMGEHDRAPTPDSDSEEEANGGKKPPLRIVIDKSGLFSAGVTPGAKSGGTGGTVGGTGGTAGPSATPLTPTSTPADTVMEDAGGLELFTRILCPRNIVLLSSSRCPAVSWDRLATVLCWLVKRGYLTPHALTEQCLAAYRQDWDQTTLSHLAKCVRTVCTNLGDAMSGKIGLFLDFLADYCAHMDIDPEHPDMDSAL